MTAIPRSDMPRTDIRLAGSGGQGVVLAGVILAEAALRSGHDVAQSQSYGPQSRGGACRSDVAIGPGIAFPVTDQVDILVALNRDAFARYAGSLRRFGLLVADERWGGPVQDSSVVALFLPIEATAQQAAGSTLAANLVALGVLTGWTGVVTDEVLEAAARASVPVHTWPMNHRALHAGFELGRSRQG